MAVEAFYGAETLWMCDVDKSASLAIRENWNLSNLGDLREVDWSAVEPIDILTAGYPCQPFSTAGQRKGAKDERHLWPHIKKVISELRPHIVILENVRGHLSLGFKEVLKDLTEIRYNTRWATVRASDVGAPHKRERLFIIAHPNSQTCEQPRRVAGSISRARSEIINRSDREKFGGSDQITGDTDSEQLSADRKTPRLGRRFETQSDMRLRSVPDPLVDGKLNTKYVEYMMGLPEGWVTDLPLSRAQQFKLLGNGVVPQQAYHALQILEGQ